MHSRRRILAILAVVFAFPRATLGSVRGVYDVSVSTDTWWSRSLTCREPMVSRVDGAIVVQLDCETIPGAKMSKRGPGIYLGAEAKYSETGVAIGDCYDIARAKRRGSVSASCSISLPPEPALPIVIEGNGPGVSAPVQLPGGSLVFETTATPNEGNYGSLDLSVSGGGTHDLWEAWDEAPTAYRVEFFQRSVQAVVTSSVAGPWRVVVNEAFPS